MLEVAYEKGSVKYDSQWKINNYFCTSIFNIFAMPYKGCLCSRILLQEWVQLFLWQTSWKSYQKRIMQKQTKLLFQLWDKCIMPHRNWNNNFFKKKHEKKSFLIINEEIDALVSSGANHGACVKVITYEKPREYYINNITSRIFESQERHVKWIQHHRFPFTPT